MGTDHLGAMIDWECKANYLGVLNHGNIRVECLIGNHESWNIRRSNLKPWIIGSIRQRIGSHESGNVRQSIKNPGILDYEAAAFGSHDPWLPNELPYIPWMYNSNIYLKWHLNEWPYKKSPQHQCESLIRYDIAAVSFLSAFANFRISHINRHTSGIK